ncbi:MAG: flagellar hook-basal body complex protein [Synergistaceae bacterium]|jgi:flagellar hook-basal body protein|nr:flagellar hook-basal body complex protein [Synergistaceae bacterium]
MLRSLYSAVSGVKAHQTYLDVTGNNIANVNTVGFKRDVIHFRDMVYQTIKNPSAPDSSVPIGGVNPAQVGLGVKIGSIETAHTQGSTQTTGIPTDMMIQGSGFFVVKNGSSQLYTRAGNFALDKDGNLVMQGNGYAVQGYSYKDVIDAATGAMTRQKDPALTNITIPIGQKIPAKATTLAKFKSNLCATASAEITDMTSIPGGINKTLRPQEYAAYGGEEVTYVGLTAPAAGMVEGDTWFNTQEKKVYIYREGAWNYLKDADAETFYYGLNTAAGVPGQYDKIYSDGKITAPLVSGAVGIPDTQVLNNAGIIGGSTEDLSTPYLLAVPYLNKATGKLMELSANTASLPPVAGTYPDVVKYTGSGVPSIAASTGDKYLDISAGIVYEHNGTDWTTLPTVSLAANTAVIIDDGITSSVNVWTGPGTLITAPDGKVDDGTNIWAYDGAAWKDVSYVWQEVTPANAAYYITGAVPPETGFYIPNSDPIGSNTKLVPVERVQIGPNVLTNDGSGTFTTVDPSLLTGVGYGPVVTSRRIVDTAIDGSSNPVPPAIQPGMKAGMTVLDTSTGKIYQLNTTRTAWVEIDPMAAGIAYGAKNDDKIYVLDSIGGITTVDNVLDSTTGNKNVFKFAADKWTSINDTQNSSSALSPSKNSVTSQANLEAFGASMLKAYDHEDKFIVYDSRGNPHTVIVTYRKVLDRPADPTANPPVAAEAEWDWYACYVDESGNALPQYSLGAGTLVFGDDGLLKRTYYYEATPAVPDPNGTNAPTAPQYTWEVREKIIGDPAYDSVATGKIVADFNLAGAAGTVDNSTNPPTYKSNMIVFDFLGDSPINGATNFGSESTTKMYDQDGYTMGILNDWSVSGTGVITGSYSNGRSLPIAQVALAMFANAQGLSQVGETCFAETVNSGMAMIGAPQTNGAGSIEGNAIEMSNVDLSEEFVNLIRAQRGFQANTRVVTTSDQVLEELINMKR